MKKAIVIVLAILMTLTFSLITDKKAEAFDIGFIIGPLYPVIMVTGGLILFRNHPECRNADSLGALGDCAQKQNNETSDQEKVEAPTETK